MPTECSASLFDFAPVEGRRVVAGFDGGEAITSDAGVLLWGYRSRHSDDRALCRLLHRSADVGTGGAQPPHDDHSRCRLMAPRSAARRHRRRRAHARCPRAFCRLHGHPRRGLRACRGHRRAPRPSGDINPSLHPADQEDRTIPGSCGRKLAGTKSGAMTHVLADRAKSSSAAARPLLWHLSVASSHRLRSTDSGAF